jgi:AraC-like DNA-binding protein
MTVARGPGPGVIRLTDDPGILRISTRGFPEHERIEAFREIFGRAIIRIEMDPVPDSPFYADLTLRALPGLGMGSGFASPMRVRHTAELIDNDDPVLAIIQAGSGTVEQRGREATISAGQAILTTNGDAGTFTKHTAVRLMNFRLNRVMLASYLPDPEAAMITPIPATNRALRLLTGYAANMVDELATATPELQRAFSIHMHDLAAMVLGATRDGAELARNRGVRAARLDEIKAHIVRNLVGQDLSIRAVAARHGISARYLRKLFESEGASFTNFVLRERLARAHRMLVDPRFADRQVSAVAFAAGFNDLSYFNRAFRQHFGMTPSDVRAAARDATR